MHLGPIDYVLWFAAPVLQLVILISLLRRDLHREYPFFFSYTVLQVVSVAALFVIYQLFRSAY